MIRKTVTLLCMGGLSLLPACATRSHSQPQTWRNPKDGMRFVWIPAGSLSAEVPAKDPNDPGRTVPKVVTFGQGFWLGRTEVTVGQFRRFVAATAYVTDAEKAANRYTWASPGFPQADDHPVVYLSYADARAYAAWAGVDLPTEAEWVYACRAGTTTTFYWGDQMDDRYAWHRCNTDGTGTRPVARRLPNPWGLHDTVGNAWEYTKVAEGCFALRGGAWTRCATYRFRTGDMTGDMFVEAVQPRLQACEPHPQFPPYPWDDDRGFRCIRRTGPAADYLP